MRVVSKGFDPIHIGFAAKPGQLALGIVAMALLGGGDGGLFTQGPVEDAEGLPITQRIEGFDTAKSVEKRMGFID